MSRESLISIVMPQMGESLAEGTLVRWLKKTGDIVQRDEPLFEISTDKVDTDVPSSATGVLEEILVAEGQTVAVGTVVATIMAKDAAATPAAAATQPAAEPSDAHFRSEHAPQVVVRRGRSSSEGGAPGQAAPASTTFTPAVLDAARRADLSLAKLTSLAGSGRGGRISKRDVERFLAREVQPRDAASQAEGPRSQTSAAPREYLYTPTDDDRVVPMSPVRRKIAQHMTWSVRISPHATAFAECDMASSVAALGQHRARFEAESGAPLTYTVLAAKAVADALRDFPSLNASVVGDSLVFKPQVHLGMAVALKDTDDLVVPVVRSAGELSLAQLARAVADLATRARERRLKPEDVQGGTFTLTNPGVFGGLTGTPILNQPQVGIVGLGAITKRAVVINDAIAIRPMMTIALTFDHRAADGMLAFRFLERVRRVLERPPAGLGTDSQ